MLNYMDEEERLITDEQLAEKAIIGKTIQLLESLQL